MKPQLRLSAPLFFIRLPLLPRPGRWLAALAAFLFIAAAPAAEEPASTNRCVIPVPRTDATATNRLAELNRRVKENAGAAQLIFIGDSITQGWEGNGREVWAKYYAHRNALNLGIGSDRTEHVLWRLEHGNLDGLHPKVAVVLIGVNNAPDESNSPRMILEGVTAVVAKLREKLPQTKILLLGIFPFREDFHPQRAKVLEVNQALHKLDDGEWVRFLDFGYIFLARDGHIPVEMMRDFVHPTPHGYQLWAETMEPTLAALLGDQPVRP